MQIILLIILNCQVGHLCTLKRANVQVLISVEPLPILVTKLAMTFKKYYLESITKKTLKWVDPFT